MTLATARSRSRLHNALHSKFAGFRVGEWACH